VRGPAAACQAALDSGTAGTRHGAAPHLSILVEEETLAGSVPGAAGAPTPVPVRHGWTITGNPNGTLHFTHPNGWPPTTAPSPPRTSPAPPKQNAGLARASRSAGPSRR